MTDGYQVRFLRAATRELARIDHRTAVHIVSHIQRLAEKPDAVKHEILTAELAGLCKLRVGDYRVIYEVLREEHVVLIHAIGHRKDIYRKH